MAIMQLEGKKKGGGRGTKKTKTLQGGYLKFSTVYIHSGILAKD
jgi:hypothetical protein